MLYERLTLGEVSGSYSVTFCTTAEILLRNQNYFTKKIKKKKKKTVVEKKTQASLWPRNRTKKQQ